VWKPRRRIRSRGWERSTSWLRGAQVTCSTTGQDRTIFGLSPFLRVTRPWAFFHKYFRDIERIQETKQDHIKTQLKQFLMSSTQPEALFHKIQQIEHVSQFSRYALDWLLSAAIISFSFFTRVSSLIADWHEIQTSHCLDQRECSYIQELFAQPLERGKI